MGILTEDMKRLVTEQRLGFVATVCPDGTPNLSPKGTTAIWDDDHIVFADIRSPATVPNLRRNPSTEINVVDPMVRKGYRFKGVASVLTEGVLFEQIVDFYRAKRNLEEGLIPSLRLQESLERKTKCPHARTIGSRCRRVSRLGQLALPLTGGSMVRPRTDKQFSLV